MLFDELTESKLIRLVDKTILFIGYGFHDAPILRLLIRSGSQHPIFVVAPTNPIDDRIANISQRSFYWLPKTFAAFVSEFVEAFSARNPSFETAFMSFLYDAGADLTVSSRWTLRECAQTASLTARERYVNRTRRTDTPHVDRDITPIERPDTGPDFGRFKDSSQRIMAIIGESGSGKSTLLFQIHDRNSALTGDLYIYYDAQSFQSIGSMRARLALDFAVEPTGFGSLLQQIDSTLAKTGARLFILIDALNESISIDPLVTRYEIESVARESPSNIRFIYSCRRVFWDARMNPANDLPLSLYFDGKPFLLSQFSVREAKSAYEHYSQLFRLKSKYETLSNPLREHIRDPLMLRLISEVYNDSVLPQFAPAVLVFRAVMDDLRRRYRHTPLIDFLDLLIDQRLERLLENADVDDIFSYRSVRTDSNLALLAQQQMLGRHHAEHPLTILEDENVISPMESIAARFKFTYERFFEYLLGVRLHYKVFITAKLNFTDFVEKALDRFRNTHYSFYQGLKSAFVIEYLASIESDRRREIAQLVRHPNRAVAAFGRDVLREVVFELDQDAVGTLALVADGQASALKLVLDLGFEVEGVLPHAIKALFQSDREIRRQAVSCLMFHGRNFGSSELMKSMIFGLAGSGTVGRETLAIGLIYFFAAYFSMEIDKSITLEGMRQFLVRIMVRYPDRVDIASVSAALAETVEVEGPLFFGANYAADGIVYPWQESRKGAAQYCAAVRSILNSASPEVLYSHLEAIVVLSSIRVEGFERSHRVKLFAYQIEYRIIQWALIGAWAKDSSAILGLLDLIIERGGAFNIDFALGIVEHALFQNRIQDRSLLKLCYDRMSQWVERFELRFSEFYLALEDADPFSFNLVPLAVLARVEAQFFTTETGVIPCIAAWAAGPSVNRRKMALLAANWLGKEFPAKVLSSLESTVLGQDLTNWYNLVLASFERHSPRLLEDFFNKMRFPTHRRADIRSLGVASNRGEVQYQCESFFSWLFLGDRSHVRELCVVYDMIY